MAEGDDLNINIGGNSAGVETASNKAKASIKGVADSGRELDAALRRLRSAIDPTFLAMEKYNKAHQENLALKRAGVITNKEYHAGMKAAKAALDQETQAIYRRSAAGQAAMAAENERAKKIQAQLDAEAATAKRVAAEKAQAAREERAVKEKLEAQERAAIKLAAQLARQSAVEARGAARQPSRQAVGRGDPNVQGALRSIAEVDRALEFWMAKAEQLSQKTAAAAAAAASASTAKIANVHRAQAEKIAADAQDVHNRIITLEREKAGVIATTAARTRAASTAQRQADRQAVADAGKAASARKKVMADADKAARDSVKAIEQAAKAERMLADEANNLRASIDPAFAAQQRYNETMARATQLLMANKLQTGEWTAIQRQAKTQMDVNVRSMGQMNSMYVQLGYQAQDVSASLASGINPLVILAQQGGQTASAMSMMGGRIGRVAAFFAGPWGAAIIGFTLLLGFLWDSMSEGESKTKDLMNAEDRRKMSLKELTAALKDYIKTQKEANDTTEVAARNQAQQMANERAVLAGKLATAQAELEEAQATAMGAAGDPGAAAAAAIGILILETRVKSLQKAWTAALTAETEARAGYAAGVADMTRLERQENAAKQEALETFRKVLPLAISDQMRMIAQVGYTAKLAEITAHFTKLKEAETAARKANEKAARDEAKATYQSRTDAIGDIGKAMRTKGFDISGNSQFRYTSGHANDVDHNKHAIDVNIPGFGPGNREADNAVARERMEKEVRTYQAAGFRVLWNGKVYPPHGGGPKFDIPKPKNAKGDWEHKSHAHFYAPKEIVGKPAGSQLAGDLQEGELQAIQDQHDALIASMEFRKELAGEDLAMVLKIQDEKLAAIIAFYGAESEQALRAQEEKVRIQQQIEKRLVEGTRNGIQQRLALAETAAKTEEELQGIKAQRIAEINDFMASQGLISEQQALENRAAMLDQEFAAEVAHEQRIYQLKAQALRDQLAIANLPVEQAQKIHEELERLEAEHLGRMDVMQGKHAADVQRVNLDAATITMNKWREVTTTFTSSLGSAFQGFWTHQMTLQQAFIQAADAQVYKLVDMGLKALENWVMQQFQMTATQQAQDAIRTQSTIAAERTKELATGQGISKQVQAITSLVTQEAAANTASVGAKVTAEAIKKGASLGSAEASVGATATAATSEITTHAATAAAGAYKSTVVIPFIGPIAAPAAAALALAAVLGFGALISARGGQGEVKHDGQLTQLHKKEMVLPAWIAEPMRQAFVAPPSSRRVLSGASQTAQALRQANINTSNGGDTHFHYQPKHTNMGADFEVLLRKDGRMMRKWLHNEIRNGSLKFP